MRNRKIISMDDEQLRIRGVTQPFRNGLGLRWQICRCKKNEHYYSRKTAQVHQKLQLVILGCKG
jgi:hypothetical protein